MTSTGKLIAYLTSAGLRVPISGQVPAQRPPRFITVERVGGERTHLWDHPLLAVQVWAQTQADAVALADRVAALLMDWQMQPYVASADVQSVYAFPDPDSRVARFQITVSATLALA
jgi:hypothetical protein